MTPQDVEKFKAAMKDAQVVCTKDSHALLIDGIVIDLAMPYWADPHRVAEILASTLRSQQPGQ